MIHCARGRLFAALITGCFSIVGLVHGQDAPSPQHRNVAYDDDHASQCLDVYLAKGDGPVPAMVYIHGGGWRAGSKNRIPGWLADLVRRGEMSVVSVEYRFTDIATHPAQVHDCLRAIQFVRANAAKWNIDPNKIGVTGGSAGGHLTAYVSLHDDVADKSSEDAVVRLSSRVQCGVSFAGPTDWSLLKKIDHKHPAYRQLIGHEPGTAFEKLDAAKMKSVSPITFASKDDPAVMQVHGDQDAIVPIDHARNLHQRLLERGVESKLVVIPGGKHSVAGAGAGGAKEATAFVRSHLLRD